MLSFLISFVMQWMAIVGHPADAPPPVPHQSTLAAERIDVIFPNLPGTDATGCRLTGDVTPWVSRQVDVFDDRHAPRGSVEAGLAQFGARSKLQGCVPGGGPVDLSGRFVNFLVTDGPTQFGRHEASELAARLARNSYHLAQPESAPIVLVNGLESNATGSVSYQFAIVLIRDKARSYDAVVLRDRVFHDFSPLGRALNHDLGTSTWSSVQ